MKILCLSNNACAEPLWKWLEENGHEVIRASEKLDIDWCRDEQFDLAVSYTYKYILTKELLDALNGNVVNIHNSYLPFNRGASPNLWSIVDGTPRGVTLHYMDEKLDRGYIICQKLVTEGDGDTLASSYANLDKCAIEMFKSAFEVYDYWQDMKKLPEGKGTYHSVKDTEYITSQIDTYDMKIDELLTKLGKRQ